MHKSDWFMQKERYHIGNTNKPTTNRTDEIMWQNVSKSGNKERKHRRKEEEYIEERW